MILILASGCLAESGTRVSSEPSIAPAETAEPEDPCELPGNICTWLGVPQTWMFSGEGTNRGTSLETATFLGLPTDITFTADGTAYYADTNNHRVRRVGPDGIVTTMSGTGFLGDGPNASGSTIDCWEGCPALESAWNAPTDVVVDPQDPDVLWVAAWKNNRVNRIDRAASTMTWWAGTGGAYFRDGDRHQALFTRPTALAIATDGTIYVSDSWNQVIRAIELDGTVRTIAGEPRMPGHDGDGGYPLDARLHSVVHRTADPGSRITLQGDVLFLADTQNGVIRTVDLGPCAEDRHEDQLGMPKRGGCRIEHFAGRYESVGTSSSTDDITGEILEHDGGSVVGYGGDGGDADDAVFNHPTDIAVGPGGEVYVVDMENHCVRVIHTDHTIETFAGTCTQTGYGGDGGPATSAFLSWPMGVAIGPDGNVYIADTGNHIIRRVVP
jgi:hypothetical protein